MKRFVLPIVVQLAAAAFGIVNLIGFVLDNLLRPAREETQIALSVAFFAIVALTLLALALAARGRDRRATLRRLAVVTVATLIVGFLPRGVEAYLERGAAEAQRLETQRFEAAFLSKLDAQEKELATRIAAQNAFTPEQALEFIDFVNSPAISPQPRAQDSEATLALLGKALASKIVDPNGRLQAERFRAMRGEPLFLYFYKTHIQSPIKLRGIARAREWELLQMLVNAGADLTVKDADLLAADLARKPTLDPSGSYVHFD